MHEVLQSAADSQLFEATAAAYLLLDTDLRIQAANTAYLHVTGRERGELTGRYLFDVFPDSSADPPATGIHNLAASLDRVLCHGVPDDMGVQRCDIPDPGAPGMFLRKTWSPVNSPLTDADQRVVGVLHHVEDITTVEDAKPPRTARRDLIWHRIAHAARTAGGGCAAAICAAAARELPGIDAAVITIRGAGLTQHQLAVTDSWARQAEELQLITGEGPSVRAVATGRPALVPVMDAPTSAWPTFAQAASDMGASAVFVFPLCAAGTVLGTLSLYQRRPGRPTGYVGLVDAALFADIAAVVLLADTTDELVDEIATATEEDDVNIAVGILAAAERIPTGEAHTRLRALAYGSGRRLVEVARDVVTRQLRRGGGGR